MIILKHKTFFGLQINLVNILLFTLVLFAFPQTKFVALTGILLISTYLLFQFLKGKINETEIFNSYFSLLIFSSAFNELVHKTILIFLIIFIFSRTNRNAKKSFKIEYYFLLLIGLIFINHLLFPPYLKGIEIYLYFLLVPILFIGIKKKQFHIQTFNGLRFFILSNFIITLILFFINFFSNKLSLKTFTYFPNPIGLSHVYFGIFIGLSNVFLLYLSLHKKKFYSFYFDSFLFLFNMLLLLYIGARISLIALFFVSLSFLFFKLKWNFLIKTLLSITLIVFAVFLASKNSRFQKGIKQSKELYTLVKNNNKTELNRIAWTNIPMRYLVTTYTFKELEKHWLIGVGIGNVRKHVSTKIIADGYSNFFPINSHNQYLHFFLGLGIFGLLYFLFLVISLFKNGVSLFFLCFMLIIFFTESVLVRGKGILLFVFFCLLLTNTKRLNA